MPKISTNSTSASAARRNQRRAVPGFAVAGDSGSVGGWALDTKSQYKKMRGQIRGDGMTTLTDFSG